MSNLFRMLLTLALCLAIAACGSSSRAKTTAVQHVPDASSAPRAIAIAGPAPGDLSASLDGTDVTLNWTSLNPGDYNLDGVTSGLDLFVLASNYAQPIAGNPGRECIDGNSDDRLDGKDVFTIAANFLKRVDGYNAYMEIESGGLFDGDPLNPSPVAYVGCGGAGAYVHSLEEIRTSFFALRSVDSDEGSESEHGNVVEIKASAHDAITEGVTEFGGGLLMSRVRSFSDTLEPLAWGSPVATGGDRMGLQGTLPVPGWAGYAGTGRVCVWTGHAGLFGSNADGNYNNDLLRQNLYTWLLDGGTNIGFTSTHSEWNKSANLSAVISDWLDGLGVTREDIGAALDETVLSAYDVVVVGNPWGDFTQGEIDALIDWTENGGGLLVLGLGWSWFQYNDDPDGTRYVVNKLGQHFGWEAMNGTINDPGAPNDDASNPTFLVAPLSEFTPAEVVILRTSETDVDEVKELAQDRPGDIFVVEGEYMGVQFRSVDWPDLDSPSDAIAILDQTYIKHMELVKDANPPFNGEMVWYISKNDPDGSYWMHSGNPIVFKEQAAQAEVIPRLNTESMPGWGFVHEQGHNMVISACGNLFVHSGTAEEWCNVFNIWVHEQLGWDYRDNAYDDGHAYHYQENPNFDDLTSSSWILLGCMQLVWDKYGWGGMQDFFAKAASDKAKGMSAGDNAAKTAYFVEQLSHAYELDFANLLSHWGFTITEESREITGQYEPADIPW